MTITSAIVLFVVIWALAFFIVLPFGQVHQHETGEILPGSPASAPTNARILRKILTATVIAALAYAIVFPVIQFKVVTVDDIPYLTPPSGR